MPYHKDPLQKDKPEEISATESSLHARNQVSNEIMGRLSRQTSPSSANGTRMMHPDHRIAELVKTLVQGRPLDEIWTQLDRIIEIATELDEKIRVEIAKNEQVDEAMDSLANNKEPLDSLPALNEVIAASKQAWAEARTETEKRGIGPGVLRGLTP